MARSPFPCRMTIAQSPEQDTTQDWHQAVEVLISTYSTLPWFNIEWFATMLGMTKRTLQRNLKSNGILFKQAKEQVRKSKAKQLLDETDLSVQEISWQVVTVI
ncbi:AraC family transcriptional regulator [Vibrio lentus]|nr:AraC family transcriptional regulator [Vibrio lentus]